MPKPTDQEPEIVDEEPVEVEAPAPQPRRAGPPYRHEGWVVSAALGYGLTQEEIAAIQPAVLKQKVVARMQQDAAVGQALQRHAPAAPAATSPPPPPAKPKRKFDWGTVDGQPVDEATLGNLPSILGSVMDELEETKAQLAQEREARAQGQVRQRLDAAFDKLARPDLFGEGGVEDLDGESAEFKRRVAVIQTAGLDFARLPGQGAIVKAFKAAAAALWPSQGQPTSPPPPAGDPHGAGAYGAALNGNGHAKPPRGKPAGPTPEEWLEAGVSVPTARRDVTEQRGEGAAKAAARDGLNKLGLKTDNVLLSREDQEALDTFDD